MPQIGPGARGGRGARFAAVLVTLAFFALSSCGSDSGEGPRTADVTIKAFDFRPDPVTVSAGAVIVFVNDDAITHTVTAGTRARPTPGLFDRRLVDKGSSFRLTLDRPGEYHYFCRIHPGPGMTGTIIVR